jgi:hypothetical protein
VRWLVTLEGGGKIGGRAEFGETAGAGSFGEGLDAQVEAALRGEAGAQYAFSSEQAARDFVTDAQHELAKRAVNPSGLGPVQWLLNKVDGRSFDPPPPVKTFFGGGGQAAGELSGTAGAGTAVGSAKAANLLRVEQDTQQKRTTYQLRLSREMGVKLGLLEQFEGGLSAASEVVLSLTYDDVTGQAVGATFEAAGEVGAELGPKLPFGADAEAGGTTGGTKKLVSQFDIDLTQGNNRDVLADALHSAGLPVLQGDGSGTDPGLVGGARSVYDLFADGAPGTTASYRVYDVGKGGISGGVSGGAGISFGVDGGVTFEDATLSSAGYHEPGQGWVRWNDCFR